MPRAFNDRFGPGFGGPLNVGTLVLKIGTHGPDPLAQDGDIICAVPRRRVRHRHANVLCHPRQAQRQSNGLIVADHLSRHYQEATRQYRFERVSATEAIRHDLWAGTQELVAAPGMPAFVRARRLAPAFPLFGQDGAEVWYGGRTRLDHAAMDAVWAAIEEYSPHREIDYGAWPFTQRELSEFLAIHVDDFDDAAADDLVAPELDESDPDSPVVIRKHKHNLPWRELRGMSSQRVADVLDVGRVVDVRAERKHVRAVHVRRKAAGG